jgi:DNA-directed RNA polymerase subunit beta'
MPKEMPNAAVISRADGKIEKISKSPVGGWDVIIGGEKHYVPVNRELKVKVGDKVERGDELTDGLPNPHDLLQAAGMEKTRKKLVDFLDNIYSQEGVKRRHIENLIRGLTNTVMVTDPGDSDFVRGDTTTFSKIKELNKELTNKIKAAPVLKGLDFAPISNTDDFIARLNHIRLKDTLLEAANRGLISKLHSLHPVPALIRGDIMEEGPVY